MFSSSNNIAHMMVPSPAPPLQAASATVDIIHGGDFGFLHQVQDLGYGTYWPAAYAPPSMLESAPAEDDHLFAAVGRRKRPMTKSDRHSKIYTSQGPRDRRVRLSIGIARKFFDLQEVLGFDKPSRTLDWLLTESNSAIKELVQAKQNDAVKGGGCTASSSLSEVENNFGKSRLGQPNSNGRSVDKHRGLSAPRKDKDKTAADLVKELRVKARARARARTREKKLNQIINTRDLNCDSNPNFPFQIQYMNNQIQEACRILGGSANCSKSIISSSSSSLSSSSSSSSMISRKVMTMKHHPPNWGHQQNLLISRDIKSTGGQNNVNNWDVAGFSFTSTSQPLYGILDQPKFINSSNSSS